MQENSLKLKFPNTIEKYYQNILNVRDSDNYRNGSQTEESIDDSKPNATLGSSGFNKVGGELCFKNNFLSHSIKSVICILILPELNLQQTSYILLSGPNLE